MLTVGDSRYRADVDVGVMFSTPKLSVGLSATHITRYLYENDWFSLPMNAYGFIEYAIDIGDNLRFTPRAQVSGVFSTFRNDTLDLMKKVDLFYEFGGVFEINNRLWIGGSYRLRIDQNTFADMHRTSGAIVGMLGINLGTNLRFGYSYDFKSSIRTANVRTFGTHEIMLNYRIRLIDNTDHSIDFAPRFFD
jgi:type IX secretion system PorP/SprF family membrane protein